MRQGGCKCVMVKAKDVFHMFKYATFQTFYMSLLVKEGYRIHYYFSIHRSCEFKKVSFKFEVKRNKQSII